jgi:hypothetical protein
MKEELFKMKSSSFISHRDEPCFHLAYSCLIPSSSVAKACCVLSPHTVARAAAALKEKLSENSADRLLTASR